MIPLIGHREIIAIFERAIAHGTLAHAYLIVGPPHIGKATVARWLASRLLCGAMGDGARPCGTCAGCTQVVAGMHPDVLTLSDASLGVDAARAWVGALRTTSLLAGWKVGMVEGAELATREAANSYLKAIEEPTAHTCIILTAPSVRSVLPTIASRCAVLRLRRVPAPEIAAGLVSRGIADAHRAHAFAEEAEGCPGTACAWLADPELHATYLARAQSVRLALRGGIRERLRWVEAVIQRLPEDRIAARSELLAHIAACRTIARALAAAAVGVPHTTTDVLPAVSLSSVVSWMGVILRAPRYLAGNVAPRLVLETLMLGYP